MRCCSCSEIQSENTSLFTAKPHFHAFRLKGLALAKQQRQLLLPRSTRGVDQFRLGDLTAAQLETRWLQHARIVISSLNQPILYKHQSRLSVPVVWSQNVQHCNTFVLWRILLRQPVDEDEECADRRNERKNDGVHGFLPSDGREDVVNLPG